MNCLLRISLELFGFCSWVYLVDVCSLTGLLPGSGVFTKLWFPFDAVPRLPFFTNSYLTTAISKPNPQLVSKGKVESSRRLLQKIIYWCRNGKLAQSGRAIGGLILLFLFLFKYKKNRWGGERGVGNGHRS